MSYATFYILFSPNPLSPPPVNDRHGSLDDASPCPRNLHILRKLKSALSGIPHFPICCVPNMLCSYCHRFVTKDVPHVATCSRPGPNPALDLRKLSVVAMCMDDFLREENAAFAGLLQQLDSNLKQAEYEKHEAFEACRQRNLHINHLERLNDQAERTMIRLRLERDVYAQRAMQLEQWLSPYLQSCEDFEALASTRPTPPLSEQSVDDIIDLTTDEVLTP